MNLVKQTAFRNPCDEQVRLRKQLAQAIRSLVHAQASQLQARRAAGERSAPVDEDLQAAAAEWRLARQCYLEHRSLHGCVEQPAVQDDLEFEVN